MARRSKSKRHNKGLLAIAIFKLAKGAILLAVTAGVLTLLHKDVAGTIEHWIDLLRIDPDNRYIAAVLERLQLIHNREIKQLGFLTGFYAALFTTEGVGLFLEKHWAEWLTIVATGLFIPVELYELWKEPTAVKTALLIGNIAVVGFLIYLVRKKQETC
jgi:uncharacterized membrane protein (DUF2068 family)